MNARKIIVSSIFVFSLLLGGCQDDGETVETGTNKTGLGETVSTENMTIDDETTDKGGQTTIADESTKDDSLGTGDETTTGEMSEETSEETSEENPEETTEVTTGDVSKETIDKITSETETTKESAEKQTTNKVTTEKITTEKTTTQKVTEETTQKATTDETTTGSSTLNEEEAYKKDMQEKRAIAVAKIKKIMPTIVTPSMTELQKVIAIHDWIVTNVDYPLSQYQTGNISKYSHTAWGGLENGYVVCNGYVELFRMMAAEVGIEAKDISGYGNIGLGDQHHSWSQVKIDGKWYNVDMTWDDPVWSNKEFDDNGSINYNYFLLSDEEFYKDHRVYGEGEYYTMTPSVCSASISIPTIIDASVTKRAVYFYDESDYSKLKKEIEAIVKTNIDSFAVYCMNGNYVKHKRTVDGMVVKTLGKYVEGNTDIQIRGYDILYFEKDNDLLVASGEKECIEMLKKVIEANEKGITLNFRCVDEAFADDKENYDGDMYYNKEHRRREAVLYKWAGKAGIHHMFGCISGDGYAYIHIWDNHDYGKVIVSDNEENALKLIKEYLDSLQNVSDARICLVFPSEALDEKDVGRYLFDNRIKTEYNLSMSTPNEICESVYAIYDITVSETNRIDNVSDLKTFIEAREAENKLFYLFYYDNNITKDNYKEYMYGLYENIGGLSLYNTTYVRDGLVFILY